MRTSTLPLVLLAAACGSDPAPQERAPAPPPAAPPPALAPQPGADLAGPVAPPARGSRVARPGGDVPVDLGSDRAVHKVAVPTPPRGGAVTFVFDEDKKGWVAAIPERAQLPSVAYGGEKIFISGGFESISFYALNAQDGHIEWASQHLEDNGPTAAIYQDQRVIFNTESCTLFVMSAQTGKKLWHKYLGDPTLAQPAVDGNLVYAQHPGSSATGAVFSAYKLANGDEVWSHEIDGELLAAPVVHGDSVYATSVGGKLYRFDKKTGKLAWSKALRATSPPWVVGNELFLSHKDGDKGDHEEQIVVDANSGKVLREHHSMKVTYLNDVPRDLSNWKQVWAYEGSRPVVSDGVRYEAMGGVIQASDPRTGDAFWTRRYPAAVTDRSVSTVAVAGPQVVIATRKGELFGLDIDTGYTLWAYDIGKPVTAQPVVAKGWVYATTVDGTVVALQVGDSTLDGWHMWGGNPHHNGPVSTPKPAPAKHASN